MPIPTLTPTPTPTSIIATETNLDIEMTTKATIKPISDSAQHESEALFRYLVTYVEVIMFGKIRHPNKSIWFISAVFISFIL